MRARWCIAVSLAALSMVACGAEDVGGPADAAPFVPEVRVDVSSPDVADTLGDTTPTQDTSNPRDTTPTPDTSSMDTTTTDTTPPQDTTAPDTADTPTAADTESATTCPTPTLLESFPPPFPPSPFGEWPHAEGCLAGRHDAILVLGCPSQDDGSPSRCQERRAEQADFLYEAGLADHLIVSGAAVHTPHVEAEALAALLVARGVPEDVILREPLARHTDENLYYGTRLMQSRGWTSAIVVSDEPGHLVYTALCDANCCVELGRLMVAAADDDSALAFAAHRDDVGWCRPPHPVSRRPARVPSVGRRAAAVARRGARAFRGPLLSSSPRTRRPRSGSGRAASWRSRRPSHRGCRPRSS